MNSCRFIHCADLHLDSPPKGLSRSAVPFRDASREALVRIVDKALEQQVDFLVIAGDLYDRELSDFAPIIFFNSQMKRLDEASIPVFIIRGNHDAGNKAIPQLMAPANVHVFPPGQPTTLEHEKAFIHGWSYGKEAEPDFDVSSYPAPGEGKPNIGLLHTDLEASGNYVPCSRDQLYAVGYDYWALGHVHTRLSNRWARGKQVIAYSGMPQGRAIDELGSMGAYIVNVDPELGAGTSFFSTASIEWQKIAIDAAGIDDERAFGQLVRAKLESAQYDAPRLACRLVVSNLSQSLASQRLALEDQLISAIPLETSETIFVEKLVLSEVSLSSEEELVSTAEMQPLIEAAKTIDMRQMVNEIGEPLRQALLRHASDIGLETLLRETAQQDPKSVLSALSDPQNQEAGQ